MSQKQKEELDFFEAFRRVYTLPSGNVRVADMPDIILNADKMSEERKIGIEVTRLYHKDGQAIESEQRQHPIREAVVKEAQELYLKKGGKNIEVSFGFNLLDEGSRASKTELAGAIADFVSSVEELGTGQVSLEAFQHIQPLRFVYLNAQEYPDSSWRVVQVYTTPALDNNRLVEMIREKEGKAKLYAPCDAYWLLIVVDFWDPGQDQLYPEGEFKTVASEVFEKILIFKTAYNQVAEVCS